MAIPTDELSRALSITTINGARVISTPLQGQFPEGEAGEQTESGPEKRDSVLPIGGELVADHEDDFEYPDGGYGWVVLICCMTLAALTMGWGVSWGVFQDYYKQYVYTQSTTNLSLVGGVFGFCMNTVSFISGRISDKLQVGLPLSGSRVLYTMAVVTWLGLFLAAWSTKLWQLVLTQGALCGTGMGMGLPVFYSLPSQWFYKKRGLASGLAVGGAGFGGCISSLIVRQLLVTIGAKYTLLVYSFINLVFMSLATLLIRTQPNSPEARARGKGPWIDKRVRTSVPFYMLALCLFLNTFGYINAFYFITQYVRAISTPSSAIMAALPLSLSNLCAGIGRTSIGYAADVIGSLNALVLVCFVAGIAVFALWLTATSYNAVMAFAIVYGLVSPTYLSLIPMTAAKTMGSENLASNVGLCLLLTAPGSFGGGPIGGRLLESSGGWHAVIIYGGATQVASGVCILACRLLIEKRPFVKV